MCSLRLHKSQVSEVSEGASEHFGDEKKPWGTLEEIIKPKQGTTTNTTKQKKTKV